MGLHRREERKSWVLELVVSGFMTSSGCLDDRGDCTGDASPDRAPGPGVAGTWPEVAAPEIAPEVTRSGRSVAPDATGRFVSRVELRVRTCEAARGQCFAPGRS